MLDLHLIVDTDFQPWYVTSGKVLMLYWRNGIKHTNSVDLFFFKGMISSILCLQGERLRYF